jgi:hypothetical protein
MIKEIEMAERIVSIAMRELNTDVGGFANMIRRENFYYPSNVLMITSAILSPYYKYKENQKVIDELLQEFAKLDPTVAGSTPYDLNNIMDQLEILLSSLKNPVLE